MLCGYMSHLRPIFSCFIECLQLAYSLALSTVNYKGSLLTLNGAGPTVVRCIPPNEIQPGILTFMYSYNIFLSLLDCVMKLKELLAEYSFSLTLSLFSPWHWMLCGNMSHLRPIFSSFIECLQLTYSLALSTLNCKGSLLTLNGA